MSKSSKDQTFDPADAYDAFRVAYGITMQAWRKVTGKPGATTEKQQARKAAIRAAFDGSYRRSADYGSDKARRNAALGSMTDTLDVAKVYKRCRKHMVQGQETLPGMKAKGTGKGKGKGTKAPAKRQAPAHVIAMSGIRKVGSPLPVNGQHPLYAPACEWVNAQRAAGKPVTTDAVAYAIASGDIAAPRKARKAKAAGK